jgi:hypothetical protein
MFKKLVTLKNYDVSMYQTLKGVNKICSKISIYGILLFKWRFEKQLKRPKSQISTCGIELKRSEIGLFYEYIAAK